MNLHLNGVKEERLLCDYPARPAPVAVRLKIIPEHACPYFADRIAQTRAFWIERIDAGTYQAFMDAGFRRSGRVIYQPACRHCRDCVPLRVPVARFSASKSQRRVLRRNHDLRHRIDIPSPTDEKFALYQHYQAHWHGQHNRDNWQSFVEFLYGSPLPSLEIEWRTPGGRLIGVGICDVTDLCLSSVYFYFDPAEARRSPGTMSILREIELARSLDVPWYYLGYWINGCPTMDYKSLYRPHELLWPWGDWWPMDRSSS